MSMTFYGEESLVDLAAMLNEGGHHSLLLVTGRDSYQKSGADKLLYPVLKGRVVRRISEFETNPKKEDVLRILEDNKDFGCSAIVAIGGGSVIDIAKLIKCFWGESERLDKVLYEGADCEPADLRIFAIPTTAGSGAEATHFAVIYDRGVKFSVAHVDLLPDKAWIMTSLLANTPRDVAASSAMDAFCQGVESYWSIHSTEESKCLAARAVSLAWEYMLPSVCGGDVKAMGVMGEASHLAGQAINITKTTAPHAISYALTAYFGIPHGHAVSLMLPAIFEFNERVTSSDILDPRGVEYVQSVILELAEMLGCKSAHEASICIRRRIEMLGLKVRLQDLGIGDKNDRDRIVKNGFDPQRVNNNPRKLKEEDLCEILSVMLG